MTLKTSTIFALLASFVASAALGGCRAPQGCTSTPEVSVPSPATDARILRRPLLRMTESGSWGTRIQSAGIPTFTLYEDGLVVFADGTGDAARAMQVQLSREQAYALADHANDLIGDLSPQIEASTASDQPEVTIGVTHQGRIYSVRVYGFGEGKVPAAFLELHQELQRYTHADAKPWQPDELEVVMHRAKEDLSDAARPWPSALPVPPQGAREPRPRVLGRNGTEIRQPIRYRVPGELEADLEEALATAGDEPTPYVWGDDVWFVRTERVIPAREYFW